MSYTANANVFIRKMNAWSFTTKKPLFLETDISGVSLGTVLLQVRKAINWQYDEASGNKVLCLIAFASESLSSMETRYNDISRVMLGILYGVENFHHYSFTHQDKVVADHKPLVALLGKRCSNNVVVSTVHYMLHTPIYSTHILQALPRGLHCRQAVTTKPSEKQRWRNFQHKPKHQCNRLAETSQNACQYMKYKLKHKIMNTCKCQ